MGRSILKGQGSEISIHSWLEKFPRPSSVKAGIGHDAAVLLNPGGDLLLKVDQVVEGIHFRAQDPAVFIGRKAVHRPFSDLAAIGGRPRFLLAAIAIPQNCPGVQLRAILSSISRAGENWGTCLVGGDLSSTRGPLSISISVLGSMEGRRPRLRSGAKPGDHIFVTGKLGGSILGRHLTFRPRFREGWHLSANYPSGASMDLSDGLGIDLWRLCRKSKVGALVESRRIPIHRDAIRLAERSGKNPLDHALGDGEDYELLFTLPPSWAAKAKKDRVFRRCGIAEIGRILPGRAMKLVDVRGKERKWVPQGYEHRWI